MEYLLSTTALELTEVTRTRDDRESSSLRLEANDDDDDECEYHDEDSHIWL
jgi:hypothetical protein